MRTMAGEPTATTPSRVAATPIGRGDAVPLGRDDATPPRRDGATLLGGDTGSPLGGDGAAVSAAERGLPRRSLLPLVLLALVVFLWSSNNIASKLTLREMSPALMVLVRYTFAIVLFHLPVFIFLLRTGHRVSVADVRRLGWLGLLGPAGSTTCFTLGISMVPATYAGLMLMTGPLWAAILEWVFQGKRIGRVQALGMAIAFAAAAVLSTGGQLEAPDAMVVFGSILLMGAQTLWGGYTILSKPMLSRRSPLIALTGSNVCSLPFIWLSALVLGAWPEVPTIASWSWDTWVGIWYMIVFASGLSQVMYIFALRDVTASQAISFSYLMPVFTAGLAAAILGEQLTLLTVGCGVAIVLGLWLVNRPRAA